MLRSLSRTRRDHQRACRQADASRAEQMVSDNIRRQRKEAKRHARAAQGIGKNRAHSWGTRCKKRAKLARQQG